MFIIIKNNYTINNLHEQISRNKKTGQRIDIIVSEILA